MDCRIDVVRGAGGVVVRLAGRFRHAQVPDFMETCAVADSPLRIDLSDLLSADAAGLDALLRVRERGATFEGVPTYLQLTIDSLAGKGRPRSGRRAFRRRGC